MGRTHNGYREASIIDPDTGLVTNFRYGFGKLWHTGFENDPVLGHDDALTDEEKQNAIDRATKNADAVAGRYRSVDAAIDALVRAGYEPDEVYELEWH